MLGAGGFSNVWKGTDLFSNNKSPVAIKIMRHKVHLNQKLQQQMEAEIGLMKQLDHENILRLYDTDTVYNFEFYKILTFLQHPLYGTLVLILEYCNRGDLSKFILEQRTEDKTKPPHLTVPDAVFIFRQISAGLFSVCFLHSSIILGYGHLRKKDILHRYLKVTILFHFFIVFRDIKPENILLTKKDQSSDGKKAEDLIIKIADFGLAREG